MLRKMFWCTLIILSMSCSTLKVQQQTQRTSDQVPTLGSIGVVTGNLLNYSFRTYTQPELEEGIRLEMKKLPFTEKQFRVFDEQMKRSAETHTLIYSDSLEKKPYFFNFTIVDLIGLKKVMNSASNTTLRESLKTDADLRMVTTFSAVLTSGQEQLLSQAEAFYLVNIGASRLGIALVANNKTEHILDLEELQPFAWNDAGFCWGNNQRRQPEIKAIRPQSCPQSTYKNAQKLIKDNEDIGF
ncbi:hypothetical protein ACJD0Z_04300 [Flavobacteriaceae bacterium M23B6Z8]